MPTNYFNGKWKIQPIQMNTYVKQSHCMIGQHFVSNYNLHENVKFVLELKPHF